MKLCPESQLPVLRKRTAASLILLLAALIWGTGFIPQKIAAERMSPYAFNGWRYLAASLFIFALARFRFPRRKTEIFGILVNGVIKFQVNTNDLISQDKIKSILTLFHNLVSDDNPTTDRKSVV